MWVVLRLWEGPGPAVCLSVCLSRWFVKREGLARWQKGKIGIRGLVWMPGEAGASRWIHCVGNDAYCGGCTCHVVVASFFLLAGVIEGNGSQRGEQMLSMERVWNPSTDSGRIPGRLPGSGGDGDGAG